MAKELPYYKFHVSEWINGNITLEDFYVQGVFINICAFYWFKSGNLTLTELKRRLSKAKPTAFDSLIESGLIKLNGDNLSITFLDEQIKERDTQSVVNRANGALGGRPKKTETKPTGFISLTETKANQKAIREEKKREEEEQEKREKDRAWFDACIDELFRETLAMTHRGKNIDQAISEAWIFLSADKLRLYNAESSDVKKLVNTWMGNMKGEKAAKKPSFNLKDV